MLGMFMYMCVLSMCTLIFPWEIIQCGLFFLSFMSIFFIYCFCSFSCMSMMMGGDLLSFSLISLSCWICSLMLLASYKIYMNDFNKEKFSFLVILILIFLFLSFGCLDLLMFYISFECVLVPTFLLIVGWGGQPERLQAGIYMFFYTLCASLPLLVGILNLYKINGSMVYNILMLIGGKMGVIWFFIFVVAFLVKLPMFLLHLWLPKAHVEAPIAGSMILAGILLKLGGYGLFRVLFLFQNFIVWNGGFLLSLGLVGGLWTSFICLRQVDLKSLIAYSSVGHMGMVMGGIVTLNSWGSSGALLLMIAHGLCSSALFCLANLVYERFYSRSLMVLSGLMSIFPILAMWWFMFCVFNMAAPPSMNLFGEIFLMMSMVGWSQWTMICLVMLSFFSACYSLFMFSSTQHGKSWMMFSFDGIKIREYLLLFLHFIPMNFLVFNLDLWSYWF
nr:NADH dehydrogenase subunit 4 [Carcinoscorpius rotundicauda]